MIKATAKFARCPTCGGVSVRDGAYVHEPDCPRSAHHVRLSAAREGVVAALEEVSSTLHERSRRTKNIETWHSIYFDDCDAIICTKAIAALKELEEASK